MYKKFVTQLFLCNMLLLMSWFCLGGVQINKAAAAPAFRAVSDEISKPKADRSFVLSKRASSGQRVVDYTVMEKEYKYDLQDADYEALLKIVQAEAGNEDLEGKMLVAGVVMNRVSSAAFPDSVTEVVMQKEKGVYQFSPVGNGTYQNTRASEETIEAVERVLKGEDITQGALYFAARKSADPEKMRWFDRSLTRLFAHGNHEFFTNS
ncbi:cell wall hydrolase [Parablautia intestinalis]|jgi:spore germination cell wall hydrolase CwlJ-like protein|uniref:Cell wall hydrolase n=1 Tax=Parablautia intestinalis TaxID=2320100 RepID=A0A3A9AGE0_9FIRM|nr:cell wall hydrolase [Parablautia intestinalis]MCI8613764.1 cell wall hydrolase [Lachnospiraceae bacterium]RKI90700.1 cell wall hydrolase [Parablautia intestinalis]